MNSFKSSKKVWDNLYKKGNFMEYPSEHLVRWGYRLFPKRKGLKALDLGCGSGNNLIHLVKAGFTCYGCDISPIALKVTERRLKELNLKAELALFADKLPYSDNYFDVIFCWATLHYNDLKTIKFVIKEMHRVLKKKGKVLITIIRKNDISATKSDKIANKTFVVNSKLPSQKGAIIYVVDGKRDIVRLLKDFSLKDIGYYEWEFAGMTSSYWLIYGEKS